MKKLLLTAMLALPCFAQAVMLTWTCTPTTVKPGGVLTCTLVQSGGSTSATGPVGYQATVSTSQPLGAPTIAASGNASIAGLFAQANGPLFVLDWFNSASGTLIAGTGVADGIVATVTLPIPTTASCPGASPCLVITSTGTLASSLAGTSMPVTVNPSVAVLITSGPNLCDVNADGVVNAADVQAEQSLVLQRVTGGSCDRNNDGKCDIFDIEIVKRAALGAACAAVQ